MMKVGMIFLTDMQDLDIEFGKILKMVQIDKEIYFKFETVDVITFYSHGHAYIVNYKHIKRIINYKHLPDFPPALSQKGKDTHYVALRYVL